MTTGRFVSAYYDFSVKMYNPLWVKGTTAENMMVAQFKLDADVRELAPYINAVARKALYYETPPVIKFLLDGFGCTLYRNGGSAAAFSNRDQALGFMETLVAFLNDLYLQKDSIEPNHKKYRPISALDLFRLLPGSNCGACGFAACMAFAAALSRGGTSPRRCPGFSRPISFDAVYPVFDSAGRLLSTVSIELDREPGQSLSRPAHGPLETLRAEDQDKTPSGGTAEEGGNASLPAPLSRRELSVLRFIVQGATNREISEYLGISPHTVKSHVVHIFNKLGVNDRTQAAVMATLHDLA